MTSRSAVIIDGSYLFNFDRAIDGALWRSQRGAEVHATAPFEYFGARENLGSVAYRMAKKEIPEQREANGPSAANS